jgi:hypothetical protein
MTVSLYQYYVGHCPLSEVYLIPAYTTFRELALLPATGVWFYWIDPDRRHYLKKNKMEA